jgi:hypothetical protein
MTMALAVPCYNLNRVLLHCATKAFAYLSETSPCGYPFQPSVSTRGVERWIVELIPGSHFIALLGVWVIHSAILHLLKLLAMRAVIGKYM